MNNPGLRILNFLYQVCPKEEKYILANEICEILFERIVNSKDNVIDVDGLSRLIELGLKFSIQEVINNFDQIVQFIFTKVSSNEARLSILRASELVSKSVLNNKKVVLSDSNVQDMIKCIEDVRETYLDSKDYNMFKRSSVNYIDWLKISKKDSEIRNVLIEIGNSYIREAEDIDNPNWVKAEIYGNAAKHFANIGEREKVYELKVKIKEALRTANENNEFTELSASQTIETKWLDSYSDAFIGEDIEETFSRFSHASDFIIKKIGAGERAKEEAENPLYKLVDISHIYGNRKIFSAETEEGTVKNILFRNYGIELEMTFSILVNYIWNKMINEGLTKDIVFERLTDPMC